MSADAAKPAAGLKNPMFLSALILACADETRVEAGGALAVDRDAFSALVTEKINGHPNITVVREEVTQIPDADAVIIAAGPLASDALSGAISDLTGGFLSFFDAAAPIVTAESVDMDSAFVMSRYDRGGDDYINCPMNKEEYERFYEALVSAERAQLHTFEKKKNVYGDKFNIYK